MKKVVLMLSAAVVITSFLSCKDETPQKPEKEVTENELTIASEEIALATSPELETEVDATYLYVTAPSGLSLREYNNLQSKKLARMPYGTKVKVLNAEANITMTVGGIQGGMDEIQFNHKRGFAFNGYLSRYFPPERDITAKGYAAELNELFPDVTYTATKAGTVKNPANTEAITLPNSTWHEAYFMAQRLFDFPKEFAFPNPKGKNKQTVYDSKPKKGIWVSQLEVNRNDNELMKIAYVYGSDTFDATVTIEPIDGGMKISKTETIK